MFLVAAKSLADSVSEKHLAMGSIYPPLSNIRQVSLEIALAVAQIAYQQDIANATVPKDLKQNIEDYMYDPKY